MDTGIEQGTVETDVGVPPAEDELRLALAMRGGVSLAVWIGGAAAEVDRLCRADDGRDRFWSQLRQLAGYEAAVVDVMSGASAGGLNAVIGAAASTYDFALDGLRDIWVNVGSLPKMVRRQRGNEQSGDGLSLLEGDEYFLKELDDRLVDLAAAGHGGPPRRVDITLAATLLEPISVQRVRGFADTTELRYTSTFRFRHGSPVSTDFPRGDVERRATLARLALAGRATSSFPAAFEAARVAAPRPPRFADTTAAKPDAPTSMTGVFGESTSDGRVFCVMDGGVLDNIPIARAIDAIVEAPADGPTRRVLVYVQPGSAGEAAAAANGEPDRSTVAVIQALVRTRVQEETIATDLRQLEAHNRRARRARVGALAAIRNLDVAEAQLTVDAQGNATAAARLLIRRYGAQRSAQETSDVVRLLDDPVGTLGSDPFPMLHDQPTNAVDRRWRAPLSEVWGEIAQAQRLAGELAREIEDQFEQAIATGGHALTVGVGPLRRLTILLIDACNALYRCAADADRDEVRRLKAALYRVLAVHAEIVERPRDWAWVSLAVRRAADDETWVGTSVASVEALTADATSVGLTDYLDTDVLDLHAPPPLAQADTAMRRRLDGLLAGGLGPPATGPDVRNLLLERLAASAAAMASIAVNAAELAGLAEGDLGGELLEWLRLTPDGSSVTWFERLAVLEVATYDPEIPDGPGSRPIDFVRLSGTNVTPLAAAFPTLLNGSPCPEPWTNIVERLSGPVPALSEKAKLAGNDLMNFAAFLRDRWRQNDWMWGRMDAVVTLADVLVEPARLRRLVMAMPSSAQRASLLFGWYQQAVESPDGERTPEAWRTFLADTAWAPRADAIRLVLARIVQEVDGVIGPDGLPVTVASSDLAPLREALIASRQWQILADLLPGDDGPRDPRAVVERANSYDVGIETLVRPPDPADRELLRQLAGATRSMLGRKSTVTIDKATHAASVGVRFVDWLWLDKDDHPRWWSFALIVLGLIGLTVPVAIAVDDPGKAVAAATAGMIGIVFVVGAAMLGAIRFGALAPARLPLALVTTLVALAAAIAVAWFSGLAAASVTTAVVAVPVLLAGITIEVLVRRRPAVLRG